MSGMALLKRLILPHGTLASIEVRSLHGIADVTRMAMRAFIFFAIPFWFAVMMLISFVAG